LERVTCKNEEQCSENINIKEEEQLEDLAVDRIIILKWVVNKKGETG
jgi:hypothetical protein